MRAGPRGFATPAPPVRAPGGMHELTTVLTHDHGSITALLKQPQRVPGTQKGSPLVQLRRHEPAEQRHLWPTEDAVSAQLRENLPQEPAAVATAGLVAVLSDRIGTCSAHVRPSQGNRSEEAARMRRSD
ncbi:hypothetical protein ABT063_47535 [Streptomyces sp. NPDC002838]|uniref:hypothetical protein n=1 Tax=Streptomyces sp. NPDC002838 TaxID=3154436 RepID=UPI00332B9ECE